MAQRLRDFLILFALALLSTWLRGAWDAGVGVQDDEPAHYVTAMMVRDFLASGDWADPMGFAQEYYLHYPKVAVGQWPPALYGLLGSWMLLVGVGPASVSAFGALLAAWIALLVLRTLKDLLGVSGEPRAAAAAWGGALLVLASPYVQRLSGMAMTELLLAGSCTAAILAWARYLAEGRSRDALAFGAWATLALLTKGNAAPLAVVPVASALWTGRLERLRRPAPWGAALLVALLAGPWYVLMSGYQASSWIGGVTPHLAYTLRVLRPYSEALALDLAGPLTTLLALVALARARGLAEEPLRTAYGSFLLGMLALLLILPSSPEPRHMTLLLPGWVVLAFLGARTLSLPRPEIVLPLALLLTTFTVEHKRAAGPRDALLPLLESQGSAVGRVLVSGDALSEGLAIGGVAAMDPSRPSLWVLRASRTLIEDDWNGRGYTNHFPSLDALDERLRELGVGVLLLDTALTSDRRFEHHTLLEQLAMDPTRGWREAGAHDLVKDGEVHPAALLLYTRAVEGPLPVLELRLGEVGTPSVVPRALAD